MIASPLQELRKDGLTVLVVLDVFISAVCIFDDN